MDHRLPRIIRLFEQVAGSIRAQIVSGELSEGDRLPNEREIAERFGVSRPVVREAIRSLGNAGLVSVRQGSGTFVADGTKAALGNSLGLALSVGSPRSNLRELVEIRGILEPSIASLAATRAQPSDLQAMSAAIDQMEHSFDDVEGFIAADHDFHLAVANATHNPLVAIMLYPIVDRLNEQRQRIFFVVHSAENAQHFHRRVFEAIKVGDAVSAGDAMRQHLAQVNVDVASLPDEQ